MTHSKVRLQLLAVHAHRRALPSGGLRQLAADRRLAHAQHVRLDGEGERIGATVALIDIDEERRLREAQNILIAELNHRVKNAFSVVKSIVSQSLRKMSIQRGIRETIDQRLNAYATAHSKLVGTTWDRAAIGAVAADVLDPIGGGRITLKGPEVEVPSRQALSLSMAFYELATNAMKYGALSVPDGP